MLECGAKWNETRFCDPEFDRLAKLAGSTLDEQKRIDAYHQIQRILIERGPMVVPYFFAQYGVISDHFEGFNLKPFSGRTDFRTVRVVGQ
jgi:peptide/nickel transport system substrate-binding protein